MLFPTVEFAIFFFIVFILAWMAKERPASRKFILLAASYFFYGFWDWRFVFLLAECSLVNYFFGLLIDNNSDDKSEPVLRRRRIYLTLAIIFNLGVLGFFKYCGFFLSSMNDLLLTLGFARDLAIMEVLLPVGISFFTFQGISYVVDIYRGEIKATRSLLDVLLYVSFFPQLVAGPIVRASSFMPQLERPPDENSIRAGYAFLLISGGLFKKVVIAHYLSVLLVQPAFDGPTSFSTLDLLLGVYGYAVQIFCDFSAYSDIAVGIAALLGFEFIRNFNQPYRADSIRDFWHRWHISLSTWLRDYLFIPLGGSRLGKVKTYRNLFLTMLLGGLWHGAAWNFVLWGVLHGSALGIERFFRELIKPGPAALWLKTLKTIAVFHFVCLTWIFFTADTFQTAWEYLSSFVNIDLPNQLVSPYALLLLFIGLAGQFLPGDFIEKLEEGLAPVPLALQGAGLAVVIICIGAMGPGTLAPFIYFRF